MTNGYNVLDFAPTSVGDGVTLDDEAFAYALSLGVPVIVPVPPGGSYRISQPLDARAGQSIIGAGSGLAKIVQTATDKPIILAGGDRQQFSGLNLRYQGTPQPGADAILTHESYAFAEWDDLYILNVHRGIANDRNPVGGWSTFFSNNVTNVRILGFTEAAVELDTIGAGSTGCHFSNIYIANNLAGGSGWGNLANRGFVLRNWIEVVVTQLNIEHGSFTNEPVALTNVETATFASVHFEGVQPQRFGSGLVRLFGNTQLNALSVNAIINDLSFTARHGVFEVDEGCRLYASGVRSKSNTGAASAHAVVSLSGTNAATAEVEIRDFSGDIGTTTAGIDNAAIRRLNAWRILDLEPEGGGTVRKLTVDGAGDLLIDGTVVGTQT